VAASTEADETKAEASATKKAKKLAKAQKKTRQEG
jgi:hypothetical protein